MTADMAANPEIGQLEGQLANADAEIKKANTRLASLRHSRWIGAFVLLAGIVDMAGYRHFQWFGAVIAIVDLITLVRAFLNRRKTQKALQKQQAWVSQASARLAYLKAQ